MKRLFLVLLGGILATASPAYSQGITVGAGFIGCNHGVGFGSPAFAPAYYMPSYGVAPTVTAPGNTLYVPSAAVVPTTVVSGGSVLTVAQATAGTETVMMPVTDAGGNTAYIPAVVAAGTFTRPKDRDTSARDKDSTPPRDSSAVVTELSKINTRLGEIKTAIEQIRDAGPKPKGKKGNAQNAPLPSATREKVEQLEADLTRAKAQIERAQAAAAETGPAPGVVPNGKDTPLRPLQPRERSRALATFIGR